MQYRFADLVLRFFDFAGISVILVAMAVTGILVNIYAMKYYHSLFDFLHIGPLWKPQILQAYKVLWGYIWLAALMIAVLFGMLRNVRYGLVITGIEV